MDDRPVAVLAAGGKTARAVAAALARAGAAVREVPREVADLDTGRGLAEALSGCRAVWLGAPNLHPDEPGIVARVLGAARAAGVERIVYHSVAWPYAPAMPHHVGKAIGEDLVRRSGLRFTLLQPCAYAQNLVPAALSGRIRVPYALDVPFSFVDLDDVAAATATVLTDEGHDHDGASYELGGPEALSVNGFARAASSALAGPVTAERVSVEAWLAGQGAGLADQVRSWLVAMFATYDAQGFVAGSRVLAMLLGSEPAGAEQVIRRAKITRSQS